jgi:hypothetical protein
MADPFIEIFLESLETGIALKRFIETEERKDHIGLIPPEPIVGRAEIFRPRTGFHLISGKREIAENEVISGELVVDQCFKPSMMLHSLSDAAPHDRNVIAFGKFEPIERCCLARESAQKQREKNVGDEGEGPAHGSECLQR